MQSRLPIDVQYMMENDNGFMELQPSAVHELPIPTDLLSSVKIFADVSDTLLRQHQYNNPENRLP